MAINYDEHEIKYYPWYYFGWLSPVMVIIFGILFYHSRISLYSFIIAGLMIIGTFLYYITGKNRALRALINGAGIMLFMEYNKLTQDTFISWEKLISWEHERGGKNKSSKLILRSSDLNGVVTLKNIGGATVKVMQFYAKEKQSNIENPIWNTIRLIVTVFWLGFMFYFMRGILKEMWSFFLQLFDSLIGR